MGVKEKRDQKRKKKIYVSDIDWLPSCDELGQQLIPNVFCYSVPQFLSEVPYSWDDPIE